MVTMAGEGRLRDFLAKQVTHFFRTSQKKKKELRTESLHAAVTDLFATCRRGVGVAQRRPPGEGEPDVKLISF